VNDPDEFAAAADGVPPLLPDYAPDPRHRVKGHERVLPPKPLDPNVLAFEGMEPPEPQPRRVVVKPHHRRNPRHQKETQMTTVTGPGRAASMAAARARSTDPETSHLAAASIKPNRSQEAVLLRFQTHDVAHRTLDHLAWPTAALPGYTDDELVAAFDREAEAMNDAKPAFSPSRLRTARRELADLGLVERTDRRRQTTRGGWAEVYNLTEAGSAFEPPQ
jgi:hypothetical protein